jgi:hypothetical protein
MSYSITIVDFNKGDCYLAKVTQNKSTKKLKLFVTDNYDLAKKFETDLGADLMMTILENEFNLEVQLNS